MSAPWWLVPYWLDLELVRYLAACEAERTRGGEPMRAERRTCGRCGSTLTTAGTCATCDYRRRY